MVQILPPVERESFGEKLGRGISQGLSQATQSLAEHYYQKHQQKQLADYFGKLRGEHPGDRSYELLADIAASPIPQDQKAAYVKALMGSDPYRNEQQQRLAKDSILRRYGSRIRELDEVVKNGFGEERETAKQLREKLQAERDQLLGFPSLQKEEDFDDFDEVESPQKIKKIKFDATNPKHRAVRDKVLKQTRGDRKKAGEILSRKFSL